MLFKTLETIVVVVCCCLASVRGLHYYQMERYLLPAYSQWVRRHRERIVKTNVLVGLLCVVISWYSPIFLSLFMSVEATRTMLAKWLTLLIFVGITSIITYRELAEPQKRPFVLTMRVRRLGLVLIAEYVLLTLILEMLTIPPYIAYAIVPYMVGLACRIMDPVEAKINAGYYKEARKKLLARKDLIRIGITGSYGKTALKFILSEILTQKYSVLATPASFNTAMGISRVINDSLDDKHQVFIAEMGARHVGDIRYLVNLVHPKIGILTSIGPQHLDSFGSIANIADTKYELIAGLPKSGTAFFAADSGYLDRLYGKCTCEKYRVSVELEGDFQVRVVGLTFGAKGSEFDLVFADGGSFHCKTRLLGHYNAQNIALAAAVAQKLDMKPEEIAQAITKLQPFEKKLQLIRGARTVIDDSNNALPSGAAEALNVLTEMPGRRIVITPGLPDGGAKAEEINFAFGTQIPGCADIAILYGDRTITKYIRRGMISGGFDKSAIHTVEDLDIAKELMEELSEAGDTVLYESKEEL